MTGGTSIHSTNYFYRRNTMRGHRFNRPLTIAFEAVVYDKIKAISDELKISMAEWVRDAINAAINEYGKVKGGVISKKEM